MAGFLRRGGRVQCQARGTVLLAAAPPWLKFLSWSWHWRSFYRRTRTFVVLLESLLDQPNVAGSTIIVFNYFLQICFSYGITMWTGQFLYALVEYSEEIASEQFPRARLLPAWLCQNADIADP